MRSVLCFSLFHLKLSTCQYINIMISTRKCKPLPIPGLYISYVSSFCPKLYTITPRYPRDYLYIIYVTDTVVYIYAALYPTCIISNKIRLCVPLNFSFFFFFSRVNLKKCAGLLFPGLIFGVNTQSIRDKKWCSSFPRTNNWRDT